MSMDFVYLTLLQDLSEKSVLPVTDFVRHRSSWRSRGHFPATLHIGHALSSRCSYVYSCLCIVSSVNRLTSLVARHNTYISFFLFLSLGHLDISLTFSFSYQWYFLVYS